MLQVSSFNKELLLDIQCDNLSVTNGEIVSCSSGRAGVGYEGDTCNFTCNTGYEITGGNNRSCQGDGSGNDTDDVHRTGEFYSYTCTVR